VFKVTRLDDDDLYQNASYLQEGQFRWALAKAADAGGGYIVFDVSGIINLKRGGMVYGNTYIAGQTSPGGIALEGENARNDCVLELNNNAQDIIIRHLRFRGAKFNGDGMRNSATNVVIDHCSVSWACDGAIDNVTSSNTTIQWCIVGDSYECHDEGYHGLPILFRSFCGNATIHHTLFHNGAERNPWFKQGIPNSMVDFRNNIIFNYRKYDTQFNESTGLKVNVVGNYWKPGSHTHGDENGQRRAVVVGDNGVAVHLKNNRHVEGIGQDSELCTGGYLYCAVPRGNDAVVSALRADDSVDEWAIAGVTGMDNFGEFPGRITSLGSPAQTPQVTTHPADQSYDVVLDKFGAFPRDNTDTRIEGEVRNGTGQWKQNKSNDNNTYTGSAPADSDNDGMADAWEQAIPAPSGIENRPVRTHDHQLSMNLISANPARNRAVIRYGLPGSAQKEHDVFIAVYNVHGKKITTLKNGKAAGGFHSVAWNGADDRGQSVSTGIYLVKLNKGRMVLSRRIFLMK
jgi:hypothetical protein